ncbi:MAG: ribosome maturation factor RimP [Vicinamibacterales bacterium]
MQTEATLARVRPIVERVAAGYGLDVFEVQFRREPVGWVLRVMIDRPTRVDASGAIHVESVDEGIGIDECRLVSDDLSALLDVEDVVPQQYTLEVSSPGLDRRLRGRDDYCRFAGRLVKMVVEPAVDGQKHFEGRLMGVEGDAVVLTVGRSKEKRIPLSGIARARLDVEF